MKTANSAKRHFKDELSTGTPRTETDDINFTDAFCGANKMLITRSAGDTRGTANSHPLTVPTHDYQTWRNDGVLPELSISRDLLESLMI